MSGLPLSSRDRKSENANIHTKGVMKGKSGLIISVLFILCGASVLLTTLTSGEKEGGLIGDVPISWDWPWRLGSSGFVEA